VLRSSTMLSRWEILFESCPSAGVPAALLCASASATISGAKSKIPKRTNQVQNSCGPMRRAMFFATKRAEFICQFQRVQKGTMRDHRSSTTIVTPALLLMKSEQRPVDNNLTTTAQANCAETTLWTRCGGETMQDCQFFQCACLWFAGCISANV